MNLLVLQSADKKTSRGSEAVPHFFNRRTKKYSTAADKLPRAADSKAGAETMYASTLTLCLWFSSFTEYRVRWVAATWNWTAAANRVQQRAPLHLHGGWAAPACPPPQPTTWLLTSVSVTSYFIQVYQSICRRYDRTFILPIAIPGCWFDLNTTLYSHQGEVPGQRQCCCLDTVLRWRYFAQTETEQQY